MRDVRDYVLLYKQIIETVRAEFPESFDGDIRKMVAQDVFFVYNKDKRTWSINNNKQSQKQEPDMHIQGGDNCGKEQDEVKLASQKQRQALHKFGIEFLPADLTAKDAHDFMERLIDAANFDKENGIARDDMDSRVAMVRDEILEELAGE
ncbi:MAG: hypothetical protein QMD80_04310 [archaeon]|nr:hypothetical protein [archaeon]